MIQCTLNFFTEKTEAAAEIMNKTTHPLTPSLQSAQWKRPAPHDWKPETATRNRKLIIVQSELQAT